ncbi:MAG: YjbQ family protein [Gemmataceae bacterium]|nr:YjbQ family protein [Gemmataceae bacterium]
MNTIILQTQVRCEFVSITEKVQQSLTVSGIKTGIGVVFCPHTTAGLTVNESWDPDVVTDTLHWLGKNIPKDEPRFRHNEGNSDSHIKTGLFGNSVQLIVENGKLVLGQWQGVFFCEFDGPRERKVFLQWISG